MTEMTTPGVAGWIEFSGPDVAAAKAFYQDVLEFPLKGIQLTRAIESRLGTGADRVRVHLRKTEVDTTDVYVRSGGAGRVEIVIRFGNYWGSFEIANRPTG